MSKFNEDSRVKIPAVLHQQSPWIPACAGMTLGFKANLDNTSPGAARDVPAWAG